MRLAIALHPNFNLLMIDEGSALDKDNLAMLNALTKEHDFQVIVTRVEGETGILIREGKVVDGGE